MSDERVMLDLVDGVMSLTLNRPEKRNAIDTRTIDELHLALDQADLDRHVRVLALRGAGKDFCAGMDLDDLLASADRPAAENLASAQRFGEIFVRLRALPKPAVAIVTGRALAGGMGLATACDLVLAHPDSAFGYPEIQRGFVPAMVIALLRRATGEKVAFDLVATGRILPARDALAAGLVSRVLPAETFEADVTAVLAQLAGASATALALTKRQLYAVEGKQFAEAIEQGALVNAFARTTDDFRASIQQFLKR